jgi:hypothetical protein
MDRRNFLSASLTTTRFEVGAAPKSDVAEAQTQPRVPDTDTAVQRAKYEHAAAILLRKPAVEFGLAPDPLFVLGLTTWQLPSRYPASALAMTR